MKAQELKTNQEAYLAWLDNQPNPNELTGIAVFINGKFLAYGLTGEKIEKKVTAAKKKFHRNIDPKPAIQYFNLGERFAESE